jgi:hypothetical protein
MIPIKYIRECFEKDAAVHGEAIKKVYRFVKKHPWLSIGAVGGTLGAASMISDVSKTVLPTYHILNEQRKHSIMNSQTELLKKINESIDKKNSGEKVNKYRIPLVQPLA